MGQRIYRYIVGYDGGTAPNPFDGHCTLAICKPAIRRTAKVGDWILGFRSRHHDRVIYAMQISEVLRFDEYWEDRRFRSRRPDVDRVPSDNIYRPTAIAPDGTIVMEWIRNFVHDASAMGKDLSGKHVLIGKHFWYFGDKNPQIAPSLQHLAPVTQGHVVHKHRKGSDIDELTRWLDMHPSGVIGKPIDNPEAGRGATVSRSCATP